MPQVTSITFFRGEGIQNQYWLFKMMRFSHALLHGTDGLDFYKLLGTGRGIGFSPWPDWSTYAILQVWESDAHARKFLENSEFIKAYNNHSVERWSLLMKCIVSKGKWSGTNPFTASETNSSVPYLGIITRASIRPSRLWSFWSYVPQSQKPLKDQKGLIYTKGIGEMPVLQMATFSLWESESALRSFAYESKEHQQAINLTRELNWYSEELFARFQPYDAYGQLEQIAPLDLP